MICGEDGRRRCLNESFARGRVVARRGHSITFCAPRRLLETATTGPDGAESRARAGDATAQSVKAAMFSFLNLGGGNPAGAAGAAGAAPRFNFAPR